MNIKLYTSRKWILLFVVLLTISLLTSVILYTHNDQKIRDSIEARQALFLLDKSNEFYQNHNLNLVMFSSLKKARRYVNFGAEQIGYSEENGSEVYIP